MSAEGNLEGRGVQNPRPREISRAKGDVFPNASLSEYQEIHPYSALNIDSVKINISLLMMREWLIT